MPKIKIGNFNFKEYAAKKPIMVKSTGEFVTPSDFLKEPSLAIGSLYALGEELQVRLTVERTKLEPDFKLGIIGVGIVTKDEVIEHVQAKTVLGQEIVRAEVGYCNELAAAIAESKLPTQASMPKIKLEMRPADWKWIPEKWWREWRRFFRNCVLFCENTTDAVTQYAANYRKNNVHSAFSQRGFCLIELEGTNDVRASFASAAKNPRVVYISGIGHGSPTVYTGHLGDPILTKCNYDSAEVQGKVIHLLSCQTAKELGPDLIQKGAKAYAGYYENFTFVYDQPGTPINEMELFWNCDSTFDMMMAAGTTVEDAHNATIAAYNSAIASVPNTAAATWLTWDRNYLRSPVIDTIYGDKKARIFPYVLLPRTPFMELEKALPQITTE